MRDNNNIENNIQLVVFILLIEENNKIRYTN